MAGIPLPGLSVNVPSPSALVDNFSKLIGLRIAGQQQAEQAQQFQEAHEDRQRAFAAYDQGAGDPQKTLKAALKLHVSPGTLATMNNVFESAARGAAVMSAAQRQQVLEQSDKINGGLMSIAQADPAHKAGLWADFKQTPDGQAFIKTHSNLDTPLPPDDATLRGIVGMNETGSAIISNAQKRAQSKAQLLNAEASLHKALNPNPSAASLALQAQETGPDGKPTADALQAKNALTAMQGPPKPQAAPATKTMMVDGQPHIMAWNPQTGRFDQDMGLAQPNYGQQVLPTRTVKREGPDGLEHIYAYNTATQRYDVDQGISTSGAYGHEMLQANAVLRAGSGLIDVLQANKSKLGTLGAWVKKYGLNTPIADPDLAKLQSQLSTFSALQPAMHGFRSHSALETFDKIIGGVQQDPRATIGAIQGILDTARSINPSFGQQGSPNKQTTAGPKSGDTRQYQGHTYKFDGKEWVRQ